MVTPDASVKESADLRELNKEDKIYLEITREDEDHKKKFFWLFDKV